MGYHKVSICIPTYNGASFLCETLESALGQTFGDIELLIVDDKSTDGTLDVARKYAAFDARIKVLCNEARLGLANNWNRCLELASGEWVKFLFQDDHIAPTCIEELYRFGTQAKVGLVVCDRRFIFGSDVSEDFKDFFMQYVTQYSLRRAFQERPVIDEVTFSDYVARDPLHNCIGEPTVALFRRSEGRKIGGFNQYMVQIVDWEFWVRLGVNSGIAHLAEELATFRLHGGGTTIKNKGDYKASILDKLIIMHELAYNKHWANVRASAKVQGLDYKHQLFLHYENARHMAQENPVLIPIWKDTLANYPKLASLPITCVGYRLRRKIKHCLNHWGV